MSALEEPRHSIARQLWARSGRLPRRLRPASTQLDRPTTNGVIPEPGHSALPRHGSSFASLSAVRTLKLRIPNSSCAYGVAGGQGDEQVRFQTQDPLDTGRALLRVADVGERREGVGLPPDTWPSSPDDCSPTDCGRNRWRPDPGLQSFQEAALKLKPTTMRSAVPSGVTQRPGVASVIGRMAAGARPFRLKRDTGKRASVSPSRPVRADRNASGSHRSGEAHHFVCYEPMVATDVRRTWLAVLLLAPAIAGCAMAQPACPSQGSGQPTPSPLAASLLPPAGGASVPLTPPLPALDLG